MNRARVGYVAYYVAVAAYAPYLQLYYGSLGISLAGIGALAAFSSFIAIISATLWGAIHDSHPAARALIPLAGLIAASGGLGIGLLGGTLWLIPSVAAFSIGLTGISPMMDARVLELTRSDRSRYARVRVFGSLGFIVATPIIGFAIHQSYGELFVIFIPVIILAGLSSLLLPGRSSTVRSAGMMRAPGVVLRHRPIAMFLLAAVVGWVSISMQSPFLSIYLRGIGASGDQVGYVWSCQALLEIPVMVFFPLLARKYGIERLIVVGMAILVGRQAANAIFASPDILIGFSLLQGLGYGLLLIGGIAYVSQRAPKGTAATAQGILNAVTFSVASILGAGVGGQLGGILGIRTLFAMSAGLGAIAVVLIAIVVLPGSAERLKASTKALPDGAPVRPASPVASPEPVPVPELRPVADSLAIAEPD